jgi:competence protein ComGC
MSDSPATDQSNGPAKTSGMAVTALVLSILGLLTGCVGIGLLLGVIAIVLGIIALIKISKPDSQLQGKTAAIVALVLAGLTFVLLPVFAIMLGIMLPALGRAREIAQRSVCGAQLNGIGQAMYTYSVVNDGEFPTHLGLLIADGSIDPNLVVCPSSDRMPGDLPESSDPQTLRRWVDQHSSYIYIRPAEGADAQADQVILFDRSGNHNGDGMNILYGDMHVSWHDMPEAVHILQMQGIDIETGGYEWTDDSFDPFGP